MAEGLALRSTEEPERPKGQEELPDAATRREMIAALVCRIEAGDLTTVATLRDSLADNG